MEPNVNRGPAFLAIGWVLTIFAIVAYVLRIYSRTFLTRSLGSDDFAMLFPVLMTTAGEIANVFQVQHGMGRHREYITDSNYTIAELWAVISWLLVFISYFFLRASVMLFVLRLLPSYKVWQHRVIYVAFFLNFAVSMLGLITYGIQCIPFEAIYTESLQAHSKCFSKDLLVLVTQINGGLSCVIDIMTALIPEFLLWNVSMKPKTKRILNVIFALGLLTAATSIGRAVTINKGAEEIDSNWRLMPSRWWGLFEEKLGIIFACGPALRQLYGYYKRVGTIKPTRHRQPEEEDFVKMRGRITWRDVFWYTSKPAVPSKRQESDRSNNGYDRGRKKPEVDKHPVAAAVQGVSKPDTKNPDVEGAFRGNTDQHTQNEVVSEEAHTSKFSIWQRKFRGMFMTSGGSSAYDPSSGGSTEMSNNPHRKTSRRNLLANDTNTSNGNNYSNHGRNGSEKTEAYGGNRGPTHSYQETNRIGGRYRDWGLIPGRGGENKKSGHNQDTFLASQSAGQSAIRTQTESEIGDGPSRDYDLADMLAQPVARPNAMLSK